MNREQQCGVVGILGMRCGLEKGHKGTHLYSGDATPPATPEPPILRWDGKFRQFCDRPCVTRLHCHEHGRCLSECLPRDLSQPPAASGDVERLLNLLVKVHEFVAYVAPREMCHLGGVDDGGVEPCPPDCPECQRERIEGETFAALMEATRVDPLSGVTFAAGDRPTPGGTK